MALSFTPPHYPDPAAHLPLLKQQKTERITFYVTPEKYISIKRLMVKLQSNALKTDLTTLMNAAVDFVLLDEELNGLNSWVYRRGQLIQQRRRAT